MEQVYLCADIGATNARFAAVQVSGDRFRITESRRFISAEFGRIEELVGAALASLPHDYTAIVLALPGPVIGNCCKVTLLPWEICSDAISAATGIPTCLLNDLESQGWGIDLLDASSIIPLTPERKGRTGNRCIIAPGSDLGEAILFYDGSCYRPFATEGGHGDFAATDGFEWRLLQLIAEQYGHARWGDLISGRGIVSLYRMLSPDADCCKTGEEVSRLARTGDPAANEAIDRFLTILGRECANLALKSMAVNGVYIAGGIVPNLPVDKVKNALVPAFDNRPSMTHLLTSIPVQVIDSGHLGMLGGARYLFEKNAYPLTN